MLATLKSLFYVLSKCCGLFLLSRLFCKKRLRILCYHGFSLKDEEQFLPGLFIRPEVFAHRMGYLKSLNYNVITLEHAFNCLNTQSLPDNAVVITIDDGFFSVFEEAADTLKKEGFPSTLYLTSYYFNRNCPIFTLAVDYMFWKTACTQLNCSDLNVDLTLPNLVAIPSPLADEVKSKLKSFGQALSNSAEREVLLQSLGCCLEVNYDQLNESRILNLINEDELKGLLEMGMDIQLHTHRHDFPVDLDSAKDELVKNKEKVNPHLPSPMTHFCYPSGVWSEQHWPVLAQQGILTATTCEPKLVTYDTHSYGLSRILDSSRVSQVEFEAEMSGFNELIRFFRKH